MKSLKDIASDLGLSVATVSYVNNDKWRENHISEATAKRVKAKIAREHYRPSRLGQQLRTGKTGTIGVLLPDLTRGYNLEILSGIERVIAEAGYMTLLGNSDLGRLEPRQLDAMSEHEVEGLLLCPLFSRGLTGRIRHLAQKQVPMVMVDNYLPEVDVEYVITDNHWAMAELIRALVGKGCERIAYFSMGKDIAVLHDRSVGFTQAARKAGLPCGREFRCISRDREWRENLEALLRRSKPDALITGSFIYFDQGIDTLAAYTARTGSRMALAGMDAPDPMSLPKIMGNGKQPFSCLVYAEQQAEAMGAAAATRLLQMIKKEPGDPLHLQLKPEIRFLMEEQA